MKARLLARILRRRAQLRSRLAGQNLARRDRQWVSPVFPSIFLGAGSYLLTMALIEVGGARNCEARRVARPNFSGANRVNRGPCSPGDAIGWSFGPLGPSADGRCCVPGAPKGSAPGEAIGPRWPMRGARLLVRDPFFARRCPPDP